MLSSEMTPASIGRLRGLVTGLRDSFVTSLTIGAHVQAYLLAKQLEAYLKQEFVAGGHTRHESDPDYRRPPGDIPALGDTQVYGTAFGAVCSLGPKWRLIQFGSRAHTITAKDAPYLHFKGSRGWARVREVHHPGYGGDDVIGRALSHLDLAAFSARIVTDAYTRLLARI